MFKEGAKIVQKLLKSGLFMHKLVVKKLSLFKITRFLNDFWTTFSQTQAAISHMLLSRFCTFYTGINNNNKFYIKKLLITYKKGCL